jgi:low temperature requirement protein LtrA
MAERIAHLRGSRAAAFFNSFSPSSRAALIFVIPFTVVDAIHYYTAGTALVFSLPLVILIYLFCGAVAGKFSFADGVEKTAMLKAGAIAGVKLWFMSTIINTIISLVIGASSLGLTLILGIPYLCLCSPIVAAGTAIAGLGSYIYVYIQQKSTPQGQVSQSNS